jgi:hypothetical protein
MDYKLLELLRLYGQAEFNSSLNKVQLEDLIKDRLSEKGVAYGEEQLADELKKLLEIFKEW